MPTSTNPFIAPGEIEDARRILPAMVFRQEYLADFIEDGGAVFRRLREMAAARSQQHAIDYHRYVMGVDLGRRMDFTVCAVVDCSGGGQWSGVSGQGSGVGGQWSGVSGQESVSGRPPTTARRDVRDGSIQSDRLVDPGGADSGAGPTVQSRRGHC